ncbi:MAG: H/ACA RNA-protein complex protein Gar1 [Thermoprotei archaeon]|mgnify:CR=1 FL=1|nr:MAG: H/ACA RNA-protein complex protein Gar1 [Thermoprotei archaeon]
MRRLGKVIRAKGRKIIVKATFAPRINQIVYGYDLNPIGRIADVFGPVNSPYVSVLLNVNVDGTKYLGRYLFIKPGFRHRR